MPRRFVLFLAALLSLISGRASAAPTPSPTTATEIYSYLYKGRPVTLRASSTLIAADSAAPALPSLSGQAGFRPDPLSRRRAFRDHRLSLYRISSKDNGSASARTLRLFAETSLSNTQPVFEQGKMLLVPSEEVIVAFTTATSLPQAKALLQPYTASLGITGVRVHRKNSFIVTIKTAANGRAFEVSRVLSRLPKMQYAEPNFVFQSLQEPDQSQTETGITPLDPRETIQKPLTSVSTGATSFATAFNLLSASPAVGVNWTSLLSESFEAGVSGWTVGRTPTSAEVTPLTTTYRSQEGGSSVYLSGNPGLGFVPPGPYPNNSFCWLDSPTLNFTPYQEAYLDFWFYAKYEDPNLSSNPATWPDFASVWLINTVTGHTERVRVLTGGGTGDMTADPTTQSGWRHALVRVPPYWHVNGVKLRFQFQSDANVGAEGVYIDNVRVVGTANVEVNGLSLDPYSPRQYEWKNGGQIAGIGNDGTDMNLAEAWDQIQVSPSVTVAVIDSGVDLGHPDLNLVTGYDAATDTVGGGPDAAAPLSHGTQCAGNVGAVGNNSLGVIGAAAGVKIMPIHQGTTFAHLARAFDWAVAHGANVISNSWGGVGIYSADLEAAIRAAMDANRVVLFAAGNGPDGPPYTYDVYFPGSLTASSPLICVGASGLSDDHKGAASTEGEYAWGSSYVGPGPDVLAPSSWSYTTDIRGAMGSNRDTHITGVDTDYAPGFTGTSSSTPKVAGVVALMLSKNPALTPAQVKQILRSTADPATTNVTGLPLEDVVGAGRVNALAALAAVPYLGGDTTPPTITLTATKADGAAYTSGSWTNQNVTIHASCSDSGGSGLAGNCPADETLTAEGTTNVQKTISDNAGNSQASNSIEVKIDKTVPTVTLTAPVNGATYTMGQAVNAAYTCSDALSGIAASAGCAGTKPNGTALDTATTGTKTFNVTTTDNAGNVTSVNASYTVVPPPNGAAFVSQSVPAQMVAGKLYTVTVTMRNTGSSTWSPSQYLLGSQNPQDNDRWARARASLGGSVAPSTNGTFTFSVRAPLTDGVYNFQWRMVQEGVQWFGEATPNVAVQVLTEAAAFVSQSLPPGPLTVGQNYNVSVTLRNTGTIPWQPGAFFLGSQNPQDTFRWNISRVWVTSPVAPGATVTFPFTIKAPSTAGTYNFQWRMLHEGVQWFGEVTPNVAVPVVTDGAAFVSQSVPAGPLVAGQNYSVSVTMRNTGVTPWQPGSYFLGSQNPQDNLTWGISRVWLLSPVASGATVTIPFTIKAPTTAGNYNFQWRMLQEGVRWFGDSTAQVPLVVN